jgi:hypothetical protein
MSPCLRLLTRKTWSSQPFVISLKMTITDFHDVMAWPGFDEEIDAYFGHLPSWNGLLWLSN